MSNAAVLPTVGLGSTLLERLAELADAEALALLQATGNATLATAQALAQAALAQAEAAPTAATRWLSLARALHQALTAAPATAAPTGQLADPIVAQIDYAQARLHLHSGDLAAAEAALRQAQAGWLALQDAAALAQSNRGLTQVLAMQGRFAEAEASARASIQALQPAEPLVAPTLAWVDARLNLATLFNYQDQHELALQEYDALQTLLAGYLPPATATGNDPINEPANEPANDLAWLEVRAHVALNRASSLVLLDQPEAAESALQWAATAFAQLGDALNQGRAQTNLGWLYLRTGRYAVALDAFHAAAQRLIGDETNPANQTLAALRKADVLLLERALSFIALNLLPEAKRTLDQAEALFRQADQPYELAQTLYAQGLLRLRNGDLAGATSALAEATSLFAALQNGYWHNRTMLALAQLYYQQGNASQSLLTLAPLLASDIAAAAPLLDIGLRFEVGLLRLRLHLEASEIAQARQQAVSLAGLLGLATVEVLPLADVLLPHLHLRLQHALGLLAWQAGDLPSAQRHLLAAIDLLEQQRTTLPLEEIRTAFLDDKTEIYSDLVQVQLAQPEVGAATGAEAIQAAFATVERARSRVLLERLLASLETPSSTNEEDGLAARRQAARQRLHWLYNQLLGESGSRRMESMEALAFRSEFRSELAWREAEVAQLEWQSLPLLAQIEPATLPTLQAALAQDQQALVYYMTSDTVLAFVIGPESAQVYRRLCSVAELEEALAELRFQLGRVEVGSEYLERHAERFGAALRQAFCQLYQLLIAPLADQLSAARLLVIPFGSLHLLPFHALWDGQKHLLEAWECSYAPSASVAILCRSNATPAHYASFAGLAPHDASIPQARIEVEQAATYFANAQLYLDDAADQRNLQIAASQADVLHLATHGLFRLDNPFFSALKLADGWIDVREIYRLPLAARLVVLSACESGAGRVQGGDEVIGLARGFLGAGAQTLLVSLWNVHDASAAQMMQLFYQHLTVQEARPAAALRVAQRAALCQNMHPYFWAPFFVIG